MNRNKIFRIFFMLAAALVWAAPATAQDVQMQEIPTQQMPAPDAGAMGAMNMNMDMGHVMNSQATNTGGTGGLDEAAQFLFASPKEAAFMRAKAKKESQGSPGGVYTDYWDVPWPPDTPSRVKDNPDTPRPFNAKSWETLDHGNAGKDSNSESIMNQVESVIVID